MIKATDPKTGEQLHAATNPDGAPGGPVRRWHGVVKTHGGRIVWECDHDHRWQSSEDPKFESALSCAKAQLKSMASNAEQSA